MPNVREDNNLENILPAQDDQIGIDALSKLTGFPVEFIKKELLLSDDNMTTEQLRAQVVNYLQGMNREMLKN